MSRSNWRTLFAIIGAVALALLSVETAKLYNASEQRHADYGYQPAGHSSFDKGVAGKPVTPSYQPHCKNPYSNEDSDLCAQWAAVQQVGEANRMTSLNLRFALFSLWATVVATALLLWTLIETRAISRRELRAYLFAEGVAIGEGTHHPDRDPLLLGKMGSVVGIRNSGSTPAHQVNHWSSVEVEMFDKDVEMRAPIRLDAAFASNVPPNGSISADRVMSRKPTDKMIEAVKSGRAAVFVFGAIEYRDVFGARHRTNYRLFYTGSWPPPRDATLRFTVAGNEAD